MARKVKAAEAEPVPTPAPQGMSLEQAMALAYGHWNAGQADQAERLCQQVLQVWPEHADALHLLGLLAHGHGNLPLAIDFLRRACATPRAPALFNSNLAEMCRQSGLLAEGEKAARRAVTLDHRLTAAWTNLGIILQEAGKLEESRDSLQRVVDRTPDNPEAHNNLGNTLKRLGRLNEARAHYDQAVALNPNYSEAHSNLANLLNELGEAEAGLAKARMAIDLNPRNADAYLNAAAIALGQKRPGEALRWIDNVLSFAPHHPGALIARARVAKEEDNLIEAEHFARLAVAAAEQSSDAHEVLAQVLQGQEKTDEALALCDKAAGLPTAAPEMPLVSKAVMLMEIGRTKDSAAVFDQALAINPRSANVWFNRCEMKKFSATDPDIARMEAVLASAQSQGMGPADHTLLRFALGKAWMDAGDGERAFVHLAEGNRLKRQTIDFDVEAARNWLADIALSFTPELLARFGGLGDMAEMPIFVLGMPRSGTTLVEQILASHPSIHGAGELKILQGMVDRISGPDLVPFGYPQLLSRLLPKDLPRLGRHYAERVSALAQGRPRVVDKMPANFLYAGLIHLILPHARIIHCRRDPVDTCLSCYTKLFQGDQKFAYDLRELGRFHGAYQSLMAHWRRVLPAERFMDVDYEAVIDDLDAEARRLVAFCGLEWDDACLAFHKTKRAVRTASVNQVRQPIYRASVGRWKPFAAHLGPLLDALDIPPDAR